MQNIKELLFYLQKINANIYLKGENNFNIDIDKDIILEDGVISFIKSNKEEIITYLKESKKEKFLSIPCVGEKENYLLSNNQKRMWLLCQIGNANLAYTLPNIHEFIGKIDPILLERSLVELFHRHEILRTVFQEEKGGVYQSILPFKGVGFKMGYKDCVSNEFDQKEIKEIISKPFDLSKGPLFRASLFKIENQKYIFAYVMHHIIGDEQSVDILLKELLIIYNSFSKGSSNPLTPLRIQYKDYSSWQLSQLDGQKSKIDKEYWLSQFEGEIPVLEMHTDKPRPLVKTYQGGVESKKIKKIIVKKLKTQLENVGVTVFMGVLGLVNTLLYKYTGSEDIVLGSLISGRNHSDLEEQIGFYVNTLALRTRFKRSDSFEQLLYTVKQVALKAYDHQMYPFDELIDELSLTRNVSSNPLFDIMVTYIDRKKSISGKTSEIKLAEGKLYENSNGSEVKSTLSKFDLVFSFIDLGDDLVIEIEYSDDLFEKATINRMLIHLGNLLESVVENPLKPLSSIELLSLEDRSKLIYDFNNTSFTQPNSECTIVELFERQVIRSSSKIAVLDIETSLTYIELNEMSNQFANYLLENYSLGLDSLAGVCLNHSVDLIIAILGVLKTGSAYVPISPDMPIERVNFIKSDSDCKVIIDKNLFSNFTKDSLLYSKDNLLVPIYKESLVYVIYTSGSTGTPKGVLVEHNNVVSFLENLSSNFSIKENYNYGFLTNHVFDVSFLEIFGPLLNGGFIKILSRDSSLNIEGVNVLQITPTRLKQILLDPFFDINSLNNLDVLLVGGEELKLSEYNFLKDLKCKVFNVYGPTECTIWSSSSLIDDTKLTIGKPLKNEQILILNQDLNIQPIGIIGEICIGGSGIARGYLNRDELTREKFIRNPFIEGKRLYKTGDLGRWMPDGTIQFIGRIDNQVKIRGYRIELGEVETILQRHERILACIVCDKELVVGDKELVCYLISKGKLDVHQLRSYLGESLPSYMIPSYFVELKEFPLNSNGKLDRKLLPLPENIGIQNSVEYLSPRNNIEMVLVQLWSDILGVSQDKISVKSNFFELGGHSLKMLKLSSFIFKKFGVQISIEDLFTNSLLESQASYIYYNGSRDNNHKNIPIANISESYVLSSSQRRLWVLSQFDNANMAYNIPGVYNIEGDLNIQVLKGAFTYLIGRHESLRTVFKEDKNKEVRQFVQPKYEFSIICENLEGISSKSLHENISSFSREPFDLKEGPLLRGKLYRTSLNHYIFVYVMHHIISDGLSMEVLFKELMFLYKSYSEELTPNLSELQIQYKDYSVWQQNELSSGKLSSSKAYWLNQFSGEIPVLGLATDKPRPLINTYSGGIVKKKIKKDLVLKFKSFLQRKESTMFMGVLSLVNSLLYKYTGQEDIILGSPISGRNHLDLEGQIGFYVNTLSLRTRFSGKDSFDTLLDKVKDVSFSAYSHQSYPFDELVDELSLSRDISRNPLFDVMVSYRSEEDTVDNENIDNEFNSEVKVRFLESDYLISKFDLSILFIDLEGELHTTIEYSSDLFKEATIERMLVHLELLLGSIVANPTASLLSLDYLSSSDCEELLCDFNSSSFDYPRDSNIVALFESQVASNPEAMALVYEGEELSYGALNAKSNQLAYYLQTHYTTGSDVLIGVKQERSIGMLVSILSILKSGSAYLPIDPSYPEERISYMLRDSNCSVVIDEAEYNSFTESQASYSTANLDLTIGSSDLAYVIYTSGSTGHPKGVMIEHRSVVRLVTNSNCISLDYSTRLLSTGSVSFDATIFEYWGVLLNGGELVMCLESILIDSLNLRNLISEKGVNTMWFTSGLLNSYIDTDIELFKDLSYVIVGGDKLSITHINKLYTEYPDLVLINGYGPTENTTFSTFHRISSEDFSRTSIPIGKPINNSTVYILSKDNDLQPVGVVGELCLGGDGLARGYLNDPELTKDKFIDHPFKQGERLYKTGDLGRWLSDGNIEFVGREDDQVKIRGHRIELGEIESVLHQCEEVSSCVVLAKKSSKGEKELVSYVVGDNSLDIKVLKHYLQGRLPGYMIPDYFMIINDLPLTPNGKLDKKSLPNPLEIGIEMGVEYMAPRDDIEKRLVEIWGEILGKEEIGVKDNFFYLGGYSLKIIQLLSSYQSEFNVKLSLEDLVTQPTILEHKEIIELNKWFDKNSEDNILENETIDF